MNEIWTTECQDCGGSGGYRVCVCCGLPICPATGIEEITYHHSPCPTCAGSGKVMMVVENDCFIAMVADICPTGAFDCAHCDNTHRPLTVEEVGDVYVHTQRDGYKLFNRCDKKYVIKNHKSILITMSYKGQNVRLMPWKA